MSHALDRPTFVSEESKCFYFFFQEKLPCSLLNVLPNFALNTYYIKLPLSTVSRTKALFETSCIYLGVKFQQTLYHTFFHLP